MTPMPSQDLAFFLPCPNIRAIPIFFGDIKISLDDFYPQARNALKPVMPSRTVPPSPKAYTTIFFVESLTNVAFYAVRREMAMP
ncbi:unnamed protein product [Fusarium graminearum]|nr:unnamed protein product [Fusarium graminearum]